MLRNQYLCIEKKNKNESNMNGNLMNIEEIIEKEIIDNLQIKITADWWGVLHAKLFYKDKLISDDSFDR